MKQLLTKKEKRELKREVSKMLLALMVVKDLMSEIDDAVEIKILSGFIKVRRRKINAIHKRIENDKLLNEV